MFVFIEAGHSGVLWKRFSGGTVVEKSFSEGFNYILPWDEMISYDLRLRKEDVDIDVLSKDGLAIKVNVLIRYRLERKVLGLMHKMIGPDYLQILIIPEISAEARDVFAKHEPNQIYSDKRNEIQAEIQEATVKEITVKYNLDLEGDSDLEDDSDLKNISDPKNIAFIFIEDVRIKSIQLPDNVRKSIEAKIQQKQMMLQYDYIVQQEIKEKERKIVEASGISEFQNIVGEGISDRYLRWKGIDATLALAKSHNAKIVVIGAGKEGMPLILGNMGSSTPEELNQEHTDLKHKHADLADISRNSHVSRQFLEQNSKDFRQDTAEPSMLKDFTTTNDDQNQFGIPSYPVPSTTMKTPTQQPTPPLSQ